jgi:hypothetical protein
VAVHTYNPSIQEAEAEYWEFKARLRYIASSRASLGYIVRLYLKKMKKKTPKTQNTNVLLSEVLQEHGEIHQSSCLLVD